VCKDITSSRRRSLKKINGSLSSEGSRLNSDSENIDRIPCGPSREPKQGKIAGASMWSIKFDATPQDCRNHRESASDDESRHEFWLVSGKIMLKQR
jgi:hypothetical protein